MKYYIDEFFVDYDYEKKELFESVVLLFASDDEWKQSNRILKEIINTSIDDRPDVFYYGITLTRITRTSISVSDLNMGNELDGGLNGNWVNTDLKKLLSNSVMIPENDTRLTEYKTLRFIQNNTTAQDTLSESLQNKPSEIITDINNPNQFIPSAPNPNTLTLIKNLGSNEPKEIELLHSGFGNATRLKYKDKDIYYDYGTSEPTNPIGLGSNQIDRDSIFIISHWDFDHYSGLLNLSASQESNVETIIGKDIVPKTKAFQTLIAKFGNKVNYIQFNSQLGGNMSLSKLTTVANITIFETGPGMGATGKVNSNKAELILRVEMTDHDVYLPGDSMWKQLLECLDLNGKTYFNHNSKTNNSMFVIPHHGGNAGGFKSGGYYQNILSSRNDVDFAISVDPMRYSGKIPSNQSTQFFSTKSVSSTKKIPHWNASSQDTNITL